MTQRVRQGLLRPELAARGFELARRALAHGGIRDNESYVRARVLARAREDLTRERLEQAPAASLRRALGRHENLLSGYEHARARAWIKLTDEEELTEAILDLLYGEDALLERARRFLTLAAPRDIGARRVAGVNETVTSYLLAMSDPEKYAFAKPESALQPAWRLLVDPDGERAPTGPERVALAAWFYDALRQRWREEGFEGDLLDVHTHLFILGSGAAGYEDYSWARAVSLEDLADMVARAEEPSWRAPVARAAELMHESCFDINRPHDPYHGLSLDEYAHVYGGAARTLAWIAEHGARDLARLHLDSADAFELSVGRDGAWRVGARAGCSREEAEAHFEVRVKPRLAEIAQVARVLMGTEQAVDLEELAEEHYRSLDGKLLALTLAAYDPEWTWRHFAPVGRASELDRLLVLAGAEGPEHIRSFTDFLGAQAALALRLADLEGGALAAGAVATWAREHVLGRMLSAYLDGQQEEAVAEVAAAPEPAGDEDDGELLEARQHTLDAWDDFIASIATPRLEQLARLLRARRNVVLYGPPGTGKTVLSTQLAAAWRRWQDDEHVGVSSVEQVTFHPSYGYEEFIEGYRPTPGEPGEFSLQDGLLVELAERAQQAPRRQFLLLIDELNRGDVARIFGELITLVEPDKRSPEHARRTMFSRRPLWLPPNLSLLATMNTADKSVSLLDVAIRRRFAFERVPPEPGLLDRTPGLVHEVQGVYLSALLTALNERLADIGVFPERWLGHSFLWLEERETDDPLEALARRFRLDIIPLVEEYCFSDRRQMREVLGELVDREGQPDARVLGSRRFIRALRQIIEEAELDEVRDGDEDAL